MVLRPTLLPAFGAALAAFLLLVALAVAGPVALGVPVIIVGALLLFAHPAVAVAVAIGVHVVVETERDWGPWPQLSKVYELVPGARLTSSELLLLFALVAVVLVRLAERRPLLLPRPFTAALALVVLGLIVGALTGDATGVGLQTVLKAGISVVPIVLVPFVLVQVLGDEISLRRALGVAGGLAAFKALAGIAALALGLTAASVGQNLTYYEAPANMVMLGFLCVGLAAALTRAPLPAWVWAAWPVAFAALLLSYRRSFWLAALLGLGLVVLVAVGRQRRRFGIPAAVMVVGAVILAVSGPGGRGLAGAGSGGRAEGFSLQSRLESLSPARIEASREDRYRIEERRNVLAALRASPVAGVGLGVDYTQRYPLSLGDIARQYVHVAALWWWMKLGVLGLAAYVTMTTTGLLAGWRVWRSHPDALVRAFGLGTAAALAGYVLAETTGAFSGADLRASVVVGAVFGLLSAAYAQSLDAASAGHDELGAVSPDKRKRLR